MKSYNVLATVSQANLLTVMEWLERNAIAVNAQPVMDPERNVEQVLLRHYGKPTPELLHDGGAVRLSEPEAPPPTRKASRSRADTSLGKQVVSFFKKRTYAASTSSVQKYVGKIGKHKMQSVSPCLQALVHAGVLTTVGSGHKLRYKMTRPRPTKS